MRTAYLILFLNDEKMENEKQTEVYGNNTGDTVTEPSSFYITCTPKYEWVKDKCHHYLQLIVLSSKKLSDLKKNVLET